MTAREPLTSHPQLVTHCWMGAVEQRPEPPPVLSPAAEESSSEPLPAKTRTKSVKTWKDHVRAADDWATKAREASSKLRKRVAWRTEVMKLERALRTAPAGEANKIKKRIATVQGQIRRSK